uniref:Uncharacterized protein n=1 Tax=Sphaerodactylus townsendi TaxID=933632 RepID=A0ACB8ELW8_9SAUR
MFLELLVIPSQHLPACLQFFGSLTKRSVFKREIAGCPITEMKTKWYSTEGDRPDRTPLACESLSCFELLHSMVSERGSSNLLPYAPGQPPPRPFLILAR